VSSYRPGNRIPTRALAMAVARAAPRRVAADAPRDFGVIHFPVTVPIPRTGLPEVVTVYDVQHHELPQFFSRAERRFRRWAYDGAARSASLVVTTSEYSRGRLVDLLGLSPERVEVVPMAVDHERFRPEPGPGEEALLAGLELPDRFVVYPANLWRHKNHLRLVDALAAARARDLSLVLTGQDYGRLGKLLERARERGVADRVRHLGFVEAAALPALLRAAVGMVFPSLYEGFGTPPLEAMACGCPVASSMRASLAEVCAGAALEIDPESVESIAAGIDRLSSDDGLRARLRQEGSLRAARYQWAAAARGHVAAYGRAAELTPSEAGGAGASHGRRRRSGGS
jgi:glycosyltransferase involved in cell wall biosynthesis